MSSFIGHSVAAITIYIATESSFKPSSIARRSNNNFKRFLWLFWLIVVASVPDLDYVVEVWQSGNNQGLRITHSILFSSIAPSLTLVILFSLGTRGRKLYLNALQLMMAGLSHLLLDLSVGVTPLPLLFPVVNIPFKLPFGILPSAGKIDLSNYDFYRNLKLEMGVLLPILGLVLLWSDRASRRSSIKYWMLAFISTLLLLCCGYFASLNLALPR